jgi:hypothetical protein
MSAELDLARLERRVVAMGGLGKWLATVDQLRKLLAMGEPDIAQLVLSLSSPEVEAQALAATFDAFAAGAADAASIVEQQDGIDDVSRKGRPSKAAQKITKGLDRGGRSAMSKAKKLAKTGADAATILAPIFAHATRVRRSVSDAITLAGNEGTATVADRVGQPTVWVAETTACVQCLAYSGRVAKPGEEFPGGLTFGPPRAGAPLKYPPLHPHCRCTIEPLNDASYAAALRREAERSILRGFSLESESMATRIDAARRLVEGGVDAPKSVIAYARRAIAAGEFPTRARP